MINETVIREFWFGLERDDAAVANECAALWWKKNPAVDAQMRQRFQSLVEAVGRGEHDDWVNTAQGRLALILVTDQFPRNIYRDTPKAFAFDAVALAFARSGIESVADRLLRPIERVFFYLPFEHSEVLADQEQAVTLFTQLFAEAKPEHKTLFANYLDFAQRHRAVVQRFGRFPHRNRIVGRPSTAQEEKFLNEPGSSF
jgi:uncharacterized protein (DUF924 family)